MAAVGVVVLVAVAAAMLRAAGQQAGRLAALLACVVIPVAALAWITSTSGFVWDDLKNLRQAQVRGLSVDYLFEPTSGHWAPGHRLGDWFLERFFPFNFGAAQVILLLVFAASLLLFHRILAELFRPGPGPLVLTLLYGASVVHVGVIQWWASGLDRVPATFFTFLCILAYLRWFQTRSGGWLVVSVAALAAAFLFYVKPVFVLLYLVLIRVLLLEPARPVRETGRDAAREWRVWLPYLAVTALFAVVYATTYPTGLNQSPTAGTFARYMLTLWFQVVAPTSIGLYVPMLSHSVLVPLGVILGQLGFAAVVAASLVRARSAWRAWAFFAFGFLANAVIVGTTRIGYFAARNIAFTLYYNLEPAFLFVIALGAAFLGRRTGAAQPSPRLHRSSLVRPAIAAGLAAYLSFSWLGGVEVSTAETWIGRQSRQYLDRAEAGLRAAAKARAADVALVDGAVPEFVVPYLLVPYNSFSEVFPLVDDHVGFDRRGRTLLNADKRGTVRAVEFEALAGGDPLPLLQTGGIAVIDAAVEPDGGGFCVAPEAKNAVIVLVPKAPVEVDEVYLDLDYTASRASVMSLLVDPVGGYPPGRRKFRVVNVLARTDRDTVYDLGQPSAKSVAVVVAPGTRFCLRRLEIGRLVPGT